MKLIDSSTNLMTHKSRILFVVIISLLFIFPSTFIAKAAQQHAPEKSLQVKKRLQIVVINSGNQDLPMEREVSIGLKRKLENVFVNADVYQEYLDSARFNEKLQSNVFYQYLKNKYQIKPVDVVISNGIPAASFLTNHSDLFNDLKHIFVRSGQVDISLIKNKIYIEASNDYEQAVSSLLKLSKPNKIVVLADIRSNLARVHLKALKTEFSKIDKKVEIDYIIDQPLEVMKKVVADIKDKGVVLMTPIMRKDKDGSTIIPFNILSQLESNSNVPIFSFWGSMIGAGSVGGYMLSGQKVGESIAEIIINLSANKQTNHYSLDFFNEHTYDWRQLQKFNLDAQSLFPKAKIAFYQPTFFEKYTLGIVLTMLAFVVLIIFSILLLSLNKKRNAAIRALSKEQALLEQRVLERTNDLLEEKQKAEAATHAKSDFLANMSHEIRTPMNGVMGMLTLLNNTQVNEQQKQYIKIAEGSSKSLLSVINDILDFSKIEAGKLEIEHINFDLLQLIEESISSLVFLASGKNLDIVLDTKAVNDIWVKSDPGRIRQIFNNLISNAIKFTEQGAIVIRCETTLIEEEVQFIFIVEDSGIGIKRDKVGDLFSSFTQADTTTTRKYGGTGLGLSITKQLCRLMGGDISVKSIINKGSTFTAQLTFLKSEPFSSEKNDTQYLTAELAGKNILVIDPNKKHCEMLIEQLSHWGANTSSANNYKDALHLITHQLPKKIDIILLDLQLPELDALAFPQMVNDKINSPLLKIILITPIMFDGNSKQYVDNGFSGLLSKPVVRTGLSKTLTTALDETSSLLTKASLINNTLANSSQNEQSLPQDKNEQKQEQEYKTEDNFSNKSLLLVEDNRINQKVALGILKHLNLHAKVANNGQEALAILEQGEKFDLILMDCQMPIMDGYEATKAIRASKVIYNASSLPIIALTANSMKGDKEKCLACGMSDFLAKPIVQDDIKKMLNTWLTTH